MGHLVDQTPAPLVSSGRYRHDRVCGRAARHQWGSAWLVVRAAASLARVLATRAVPGIFGQASLKRPRGIRHHTQRPLGLVFCTTPDRSSSCPGPPVFRASVSADEWKPTASISFCSSRREKIKILSTQSRTVGPCLCESGLSFPSMGGGKQTDARQQCQRRT
jgi:hypothetical protein